MKFLDQILVLVELFILRFYGPVKFLDQMLVLVELMVFQFHGFEELSDLLLAIVEIVIKSPHPKSLLSKLIILLLWVPLVLIAHLFAFLWEFPLHLYQITRLHGLAHGVCLVADSLQSLWISELPLLYLLALILNLHPHSPQLDN